MSIRQIENSKKLLAGNASYFKNERESKYCYEDI